MLDREKVVAVLKKRFPGAAVEQVAAAANAIVGLGDEWEEITDGEASEGGERFGPCRAVCCLAVIVESGGLVRIFRKRASD